MALGMIHRFFFSYLALFEQDLDDRMVDGNLFEFPVAV